MDCESLCCRPTAFSWYLNQAQAIVRVPNPMWKVAAYARRRGCYFSQKTRALYTGNEFCPVFCAVLSEPNVRFRSQCRQCSALIRASNVRLIEFLQRLETSHSDECDPRRCDVSAILSPPSLKC